MAEATGLAIGAVSLAALFDSVINCFERFQVGKDFNETYQRYLLQLEVLKLRLERWRDAVTKLDAPAVKGANGSLVERHLSDIENLFKKEVKLSDHYKSESAETGLDDNVGNWLVKALRRLSHKHRGTTPLTRDKFRWAILGKNEFERLVCSISAQVSNLEQIIPTHELERLLDKMRLEDADDIGKQPEANKKDIQLLQETAMAVDQKFADFVKVRVGHEYIRNIAEDRARLHQGDLISPDYHGQAIVPGNSYRENVAKGDVRVTQGTSYGYNPFAH